MKRKVAPLLIIIIFSLIGMKSLFHEGLFSGHDIWHQVARLYWYSESLKEGMIPPTFVMSLANGFGYPLFLFSYHFPWLLAQPLLLLNASIENVIKMLFVISYLGSGVGMYLLTKALTESRRGSCVAAIAYLWAPYHFLVILVNAAIGKAFVFTITPFILLGVYYMGKSISLRKGFVLTTISLACLLLTHLMSAFSLVPLVIIVLVMKPQIKWLLLSGVTACILTAFYLIPAVVYSSITQTRSGALRSLYESNFISFGQLIYSRWGFGIINQNAKEGSLSFQLGFIQWIGIVGGIIYSFIKKNTLILSLLLSFSASVFFMLDVSKPVWDLFSQFTTLDYPFMFLTPAVFSASLLVGILFSKLNSFLSSVAAVVFLVVVIVNNRNYIRVNMYTNVPLQTYIDSEQTTNSFNEYLPNAANPILLSSDKNQLTFPFLHTTDVSRGIQSLRFNVRVPQTSAFSFRQFAFPGIVLFVDGALITYDTDNEGLVSTTLSQGEHTINITYEYTPLMQFSRFLSAISLVLFITYVFKTFVNKKSLYVKPSEG